jgi:hypothetical protein
MSYEVKGKVIKVFSQESGTAGSGKEWIRQNFLIDVPGQYPKKMLMAAMTKNTVERVGKLKLNTDVTVNFNVESREHNEKYYTNLTAYKIVEEKADTTTTASEAGSTETDEDDLPF